MQIKEITTKSGVQMVEFLRTVYDPAKKRGTTKRLGRIPESSRIKGGLTILSVFTDKERAQFDEWWAKREATWAAEARARQEAHRALAVRASGPGSLQREVDLLLEAVASGVLSPERATACYAELDRLARGLRKAGIKRPAAPAKPKKAKQEDESGRVEDERQLAAFGPAAHG